MVHKKVNSGVSVEVRTWAILAGMASFASVALISVYRSAQDRRELRHAQEQAKILQENLVTLNATFDKIKSYTQNTESFAESAYNLTDPILGDPETTPTSKSLAHLKSFYGKDKKNPYTLATLSPKEPLGFLGQSVKDSRFTQSDEPIQVFANSIVEIEKASRSLDLVLGRIRGISTILQYSGIPLNSIPSLKPVEGPVTSEFGTRFSPFDGKKVFHTGVDIAAPMGSGIKSPALGKVVYVGNFASLGNTIVIDHGSGTSTRYGHLKKAKVKIGQIVNKGDLIGWVGMTGNTTGPHLHYEIWLKNAAVNPREFFFDLEDSAKYVKADSPSADLKGIGGD